MNASNTPQPKYVISGNTLEDMALSFAELAFKLGPVEVVTKDKTKFAVWKLDDGSSDSPIYKSVALDAETATRFKTSEGEAPLSVAVDVRFLSLTPVNSISTVLASKKAATIQRLTNRLNSVDSLKARLAKLQS